MAFSTRHRLYYSDLLNSGCFFNQMNQLIDSFCIIWKIYNHTLLCMIMQWKNIHSWVIYPKAKLNYRYESRLSVAGWESPVCLTPSVESHPETTVTESSRGYEEVKGQRLPSSPVTEGVNKFKAGQRAVCTFTTAGVHYNTPQVTGHSAIFSPAFNHTQNQSQFNQ